MFHWIDPSHLWVVLLAGIATELGISLVEHWLDHRLVKKLIADLQAEFYTVNALLREIEQNTRKSGG
jgi:hypothetical protein